MIIEEQIPLAPYTTLGIGGPARWFVEAGSEDEVAEAAVWAAKRKVEMFVLGGGSNVLVDDAGFDGLVLRIGVRGIATVDAEQNPGQRIYRAGAGEEWDGFVERTVQDGCVGVECLAGIPGSVGGTPVQNVGAYGQEVASAIERVRAFDLLERTFVEFTAAECGFAYRRSRFNFVDRGRYVVTRVDFRLAKSGVPMLRYADLQRAFPDGAKPTPMEVAAQVRRVRQTKGMLVVEDDPNCRSVGSFFKNPVVTEEYVKDAVAALAMQPPRFPAGEGQVKLPAAWLIEQAGFAKGYTLGKAGLSSRHTLAIINRGQATSAEILALARQIADAVEARFGIRLEIEPVMVGFPAKA